MDPNRELEYRGNKKGQVKWVSNVDYSQIGLHGNKWNPISILKMALILKGNYNTHMIIKGRIFMSRILAQD